MSASRHLALLALASLFAIAGCTGESGSSLPTPSAAFCEAARKYDDKLGTLTGQSKFTKQIVLVTPMAEHAPKDIKADAELFLDALRRRADGDTSVAKDPKVERAIENVNRRAVQGCDLYEQQPGSGI
jgi:hypothetical protein